jgi:hypothetical protein
MKLSATLLTLCAFHPVVSGFQSLKPTTANAVKVVDPFAPVFSYLSSLGGTDKASTNSDLTYSYATIDAPKSVVNGYVNGGVDTDDSYTVRWGCVGDALGMR